MDSKIDKKTKNEVVKNGEDISQLLVIPAVSGVGIDKQLER